MSEVYHSGELFERIGYRDKPFPKGEYERCVFRNCDLSGADLSGSQFLSTRFEQCNLSLVKMQKTVLQGASFSDCKMLGIHFQYCSPFGLTVAFGRCQLNHASFYQMKLAKTRFEDCQLQEADFSECDLSRSSLPLCDLQGAMFDRTNLEGADLRSAINYAIDPELNKIKKALFSLAGLPGLLGKYGINIYP